MKAQESPLNVLLEGQKQFMVPLFQRRYSWREDNWATLWNDLVETYETGPDAQHFLGSIVTKALPGAPESVTPYLVIDGQQRLTTLTVLLAALRDAAHDVDPTLASKLDDLYLKNRYVSGFHTYKVLPTQADRDPYFAIIDGSSTDLNIGAAYRFFRSKLSDLDEGGDGPSLHDLEATILKGLELVSITLGNDDNEYRIFESLNATGQRLQQVDLLRNYFFMRIPFDSQDATYKDVWHPMERALRGQQLEEFFRYDFMSSGDFVREGDVYQAWRKRLDKLTPQALVERLGTFASRARLYQRIVSPEHEPDPTLATGFTRLNRWGGQTIYPFLLFTYEEYEAGRLNAAEFAEVLRSIESFLVRRLFAGVPTNALNRLFTRLPVQLSRDVPFVEAVRTTLSVPSRRWPRDAEFVAGVNRHPLYTDSRPGQRKMILETFETAYGSKEPPPLDSLTIEHVMPQDLTDQWAADLGSGAEQIHSRLLHTLGNLTLTGYNPELSNSPWGKKRELLGQSNLAMNREMAQQPLWGSEQIEERARRLAERALELWPGPVDFGGVRQLEGGDAEPSPATAFAAFYQECIDRLAPSLGVDLVRSGETTFTSPDGGVVITCLVSRAYPNGWFWWTFRSRHQHSLSTARDGYVLLGCGSADTVLRIPFATWEPWLEYFNFTDYGDQVNWHVQVRQAGDRFVMHRKAGCDDLDVSEYLLA
jgi:uncharacterized protein with ParB-like and HNH nuclease domain